MTTPRIRRILITPETAQILRDAMAGRISKERAITQAEAICQCEKCKKKRGKNDTHFI